MTKHLKAIKTSFILGILLISSLAVFSAPASAKVISYPSLISVEISPESLETLSQPVDIESVIIVQLKIGYSASIPPWTLSDNPLLSMIGRLWIFGSFIVYPQLIHLEIVEKPDWADIALLVPDVYITEFSNSWVYTTADLQITPYDNAPAVPKSVTIKASAESVGRITGIEYHRTLTFEPDYIPLISVTPEKPTRQVGPRDPINFKIEIRNMGNKQTLVNGKILDAPEEWAALISPTQLPLGAGETGSVTVSMTAPYDFGWHNQVRTFTVEFTPEKSPPSSPPVTGTPLPVQLKVDCVGFSTPGFEMIFVFLAILIFAFISKRKLKKT